MRWQCPRATLFRPQSLYPRLLGKLRRAPLFLQARQIRTLGVPPPKCFSHFRFHGCFESTSFISFITKARHAIEKTHPVLWALPHFLPETDKCRWSILHTLERVCCSCSCEAVMQTVVGTQSSLRSLAADTTQIALWTELILRS